MRYSRIERIAKNAVVLELIKLFFYKIEEIFILNLKSLINNSLFAIKDLHRLIRNSVISRQIDTSSSYTPKLFLLKPFM